MSLTRVSSIDGFERVSDTETPQPRRMSFSPVPQRDEMAKQANLDNELVFLEVPKGKRIGTYTAMYACSSY